jgi:asparagine synthase (glutamine-hydrolysing)
MDEGRSEITQLYKFNCEVKQPAKGTVQTNAGALVDVLSRACVHRANANSETGVKGRNILALSGGLDSRTVAACLNRGRIPFTGVTRLDHLKRSNSDSEIAEQLANVLKMDWRLFRVRPPRGEDLLRLLRMKNGLNYLGMAFILSFLDAIRKEYGAGLTYFTGDGGDKVLRDLRPCWRMKNPDALMGYIFSRNQMLDVGKVAALTRTCVEEIVGEVRNYVMGFPENDLNQKYVHFLLSERVFKYLFEGEDRNRCFFWSVTPFYSMPFFRYAIACPDEQKERFALHRAMLLALSAAACSVTYPYWRAPVLGKRYLVYLLMRSFLDRIPARLKRSIRSLKASRARDNHDACLEEQFNNSSLLGEYMDEAVLKAVTNDCSWGAIKNVLTVTSVIEQLEGKQLSLSKYYYSEFA